MYHPGPGPKPPPAVPTPGGSSSGRPPLAAGMADVVSAPRQEAPSSAPQAFCGVWGYKPTFATVSVAGLKMVAPTLDTVGWLARSVELIDRVRGALTGRLPATPLGRPPRIRLVRTEQWDMADDASRHAVLRGGRRARDGGAEIGVHDLPPAMIGLADLHPLVHAYEAEP